MLTFDEFMATEDLLYDTVEQIITDITSDLENAVHSYSGILHLLYVDVPKGVIQHLYEHDEFNLLEQLLEAQTPNNTAFHYQLEDLDAYGFYVSWNEEEY